MRKQSCKTSIDFVSIDFISIYFALTPFDRYCIMLQTHDRKDCILDKSEHLISNMINRGILEVSINE